MLLTVNRLGSTNISLRKVALRRRGRRRSAGGWCDSDIQRPTLARRPRCRYACHFACLLRAHPLAKGAGERKISAADPRLPGEPFSASLIDIEAWDSSEAVVRERGFGELAELHAGLAVPQERVPGRGPAGAIEQ